MPNHPRPRRPKIALPLLMVAALLAACVARAAEHWEAFGPEGGKPVGLAFDAAGQRTLYAALANGGVYRSEDAGASWVAAASGLSADVITCLAVDPAAPGHLFVGMESDGIWRSLDGGRSWTLVAGALGGQQLRVQALLVDPASHALYAGLDLDVGQTALWRSDDDGAHWSAIALGSTEPRLSITGLAAADGRIFASAATRGLYRSPASGSTWDRLLPEKSFRGVVATGSTVYALSSDALVAKSADLGTSWSTHGLGITAPFSVQAQALAVAPDDPAVVYVGYLFISSVYNSGLVRSVDGGTTFTRVAGGLPDERALPGAILIAPGSPHRVYAAPGYSGVWSSADGSANWTASSRGLRGRGVRQILADPKRPGTFYAAISGKVTPGLSESLIRRTDDGGATWREVGAQTQIVGLLALDPEQSATVYGYRIKEGSSFFLMKTRNGGGLWSELSTGAALGSAFALDPQHPRTLYLGDRGLKIGVSRSVNGGTTWSAPVSLLDCTFVVQIALAPGGRVYAGGGGPCGGFARSTDGGRTFSAVSRLGLPATFSRALILAADPAHPNVLYTDLVATDGTLRHLGVYRSTDGAGHWSAVPGLADLSSSPANEILFTPAPNAAIWLASDRQGIRRSVDGGITWPTFTAPGLPSKLIYDLELGRRTPSTLYAATAGGLFRLVP